MTSGWIPRTQLEQLIQIDTLLAEIVPAFGRARERIVDTLPGHSGRPAGNGEPGGGRGASTSTVVERVSSSWSRDVADLEQLDRLAGDVVDRLVFLFPSVTGPFDNGMVRRLVWARWLVRRVVDLGPVRADKIPRRQLLRLHQDVEHLHRIVQIWSSAREVEPRSPSLAADSTNLLCRSCLRVGVRNERCDRYREDGLCRWCGDFRAEQGFLPTLEIVDAHESGVHGSTIAKMIRDERRGRAPASRSKRKRKAR